jgi:hypothetical protein
VEEIRVLGRFPERKVVHRHFGNREIMDSVDKKSMRFRIAKSETPTRREVPFGASCQHSGESDSRDRQSRGKMHLGI